MLNLAEHRLSRGVEKKTCKSPMDAERMMEGTTVGDQECYSPGKTNVFLGNIGK